MHNFAVLIFTVVLIVPALSRAELKASRVSSGALRIQVDFKGMAPSYLEGAPRGQQAGLLIVGRPADFEVKATASVQAEMAPTEVKLNPFMPCRCAGNTVKPLTQVAPTEVRAYELNYLGDFRGVPLTKLTLRSSSLQVGVVEKYKSLELTLTRHDQKSVERYAFDKLNLSNSLVIVTPTKWIGATQKLATAVKASGVAVQTFTLDEIGPTFWDLKRSLKALYQKENFGHVLLIGDEDNFPTELVQTSTDFQTPSDLQYYLMGDGSDRIPDVSGARLAVSSEEEIEEYQRKFEAYLKRGAHKHSVVIASDEGSNPTDVEYARAMAAPLKSAFAHQISEVFQANAQTGADYLARKIESGTDLINYIGHGSGNSWPSVNGREFDLSDIQSLQGENGTFVLIDVACQNGRFSNDGRLGVTFMKHQDSQMPAGSVAYYGGSVDISWHPPAIMAVAINQDMADHPTLSLGEHLLRGQLHLIENYDDLESALENLTWYHLQGVPTLKPRL